jgi:hypothetical protein
VKKITSIALILLMSVQCFYKLGVITYFHLNREYIADVFCVNKEKPITMCYGQCFLQKNLDLADRSSSDDGALPLGKQVVDFPVFLISENNYFSTRALTFAPGNSHYFISSSSEHSSLPFHPPAQLS